MVGQRAGGVDVRRQARTGHEDPPLEVEIQGLVRGERRRNRGFGVIPGGIQVVDRGAGVVIADVRTGGQLDGHILPQFAFQAQEHPLIVAGRKVLVAVNRQRESLLVLVAITVTQGHRQGRFKFVAEVHAGVHVVPVHIVLVALVGSGPGVVQVGIQTVIS